MRCHVPLPPVRVLSWLVDAAQGIEAQTLANVYWHLIMTRKSSVIDKIDLPAAVS